MTRQAFPPGHFYSPAVDVDEVAADQARIWPAEPAPPGLDLDPDAQAAFLDGPLRRWLPDWDYPEQPPPGAPPWAFFEANTQFERLDARALYAMLRELRPGRMIEVGSGFSSLLTADVNRRHLGGRLDFRCVEPFPRPFLQAGVPGIAEVVVARAQQLPGPWFAERLGPGDVLFIDSSHVVKTGSDAVHLYLQVLPLLAAGVVVHVHDVFLPHDYPRDWVLGEARSWSEQYLVQAMLVFGDSFEVLFGSNAAASLHPELLADVLGGHVWGGGSLWLRKRRPPARPGTRPRRSGENDASS
jgi:hypothetical protein